MGQRDPNVEARRDAYKIGRHEGPNGFTVRIAGGTHIGWVYPMDYIPGCEGTWGAISTALDDTADHSLFSQGFSDKHSAAAWLVDRWPREVAGSAMAQHE
jgi:hypothetical protein